MLSRLITFTSAPTGMDELLTYLTEDFAPVVSRERGCAGTGVLVDEPTATIVVQSLWTDPASLSASADSTSSPHHSASWFGATTSAANYEVSDYVRLRPADAPGVWVRLVELALPDQAPVEDLTDGESAARRSLLHQEGLCSAVVLLDRPGRRAVAQTVYADERTLRGSRDEAAGRRAQAVTEGGVSVSAVAEYRSVFSSLRWQ